MKEYSIIELKKMTDDMIIQAIGDYVRSVRLRKNLTQAQLADRAGVHRTTIRDLELGRRSTLLTLIQVLRSNEANFLLRQDFYNHSNAHRGSLQSG